MSATTVYEGVATRGIALIIVATMVFSVQDVLTKQLVQTHAAQQVLWVRYLFFAVFALMLSARTRSLRVAFRSARPLFQIIRSLLIAATMGFFALAVRVLPLADAHALVASAPLMVTVLSAVVLAERIGFRRWSAVCIGFIGVLLILRPGLTVLQPASLLVVFGAFLYAVYSIMTRIVSTHDDSETSLLYMAVVGAGALTVIGPFYWTTPDAGTFAMMATLGFAGTIGHFLLIKALEAAPASLLQPFNYLMLVWAMVSGYIVFGNFPDLWTLTGAAVIAASGLYVIYRERIQETS